MPAANTKVEPPKKASFRSKDNSVCPVCDTIHQREQMFQGGGRLIAGKLTKELRRLYEKNLGHLRESGRYYFNIF